MRIEIGPIRLKPKTEVKTGQGQTGPRLARGQPRMDLRQGPSHAVLGSAQTRWAGGPGQFELGQDGLVFPNLSKK